MASIAAGIACWEHGPIKIEFKPSALVPIAILTTEPFRFPHSNNWLLTPSKGSLCYRMSPSATPLYRTHAAAFIAFLFFASFWLGPFARADNADLSVAIALDQDPPAVGSPVSYTFSINNMGPGSTSWDLTASFDCGEIIQHFSTDASGNVAISQGTRTLNVHFFDQLPAGGTNHVVVTVQVQTRFAAATTVSVAGNGSDPNQQNNSASYVTSAPPPATAKLLNISTRGSIQSNDDTLIGGFIVESPCTAFSTTKNFVVRVLGPSLTTFGLPGVVADPRLEVHVSGSGLFASNDNWHTDSSAGELQSLGLAPKDDRESALKRSFASSQQQQAFTVVAYPVSDAGIGVLETYDLDKFEETRLANISTRGFVGTDDNVLIGGFVLSGGNGTGVLLLRAIGPSLSDIPNRLGDPMIELRDDQGSVLAMNDNWKDSQESEIRGTSIPPTNDYESALLVELSSGTYTAIVRGSGGTSGIGLVEVYNLR